MSNSLVNDKPLAIVTGSGSGIGLAFANQLAKHGYDLLLIEANPDNLAKCENDLRSSYAELNIKAIIGDITDDLTWDSVIEALSNRSISLLINNAGTLLAGDIADCKANDLRRVIEVNLVGTMLACQALVPKLSPSKGSRFPTGIINVASVFAVLSPPGFSAYNASKAGVVALSETLRGELKPKGHHVTVILPGLVPTGLFEGGRYPTNDYRQQVLEYATGAELTPESVAVQALSAFQKGKLEVAIGSRARRYWRLKRWIPTKLIDVVAQKTRDALGD